MSGINLTLKLGEMDLKGIGSGAIAVTLLFSMAGFALPCMQFIYVWVLYGERYVTSYLFQDSMAVVD
jgi:hypothetical protein